VTVFGGAPPPSAASDESPEKRAAGGGGAPLKRIAAVVVALVFAGAILAALTGKANDGAATYKVEATDFSRRVTAEGTLKAVKATPISAPQEAPSPMKVAWLADDGSFVRKGEVVVRFDPTDFENELLGGREDRTTATNKLTKAGTEASTTKTNLKRDARLAQTELDSAKKFKFEDSEVFSRYEQIESQLDEKLAGERKDHAEDVLTVREALAGAEKDLLGIEDRKAGLRIRNAEQGLSALDITAPHDGILVLKRDWRGEIPRVGATMWRGQPIGEIPELDTMEAEVFVLEADAAGLAIDQKAMLTVESTPGTTFKGKVSKVDKLARPRMRGVPVQYFGVTLTLDRTDPKVMKPGSRVRAVLDVESRANAFAIPRQALFEKDGKRIVYRKRGAKFEAVPVEIGSSTAGRVVVTKGLVAGDELALQEPKDDGSNESK
jgi:multidrug efflux pump subunit AcrA (membrane-fusion protein)